MNFTLKIKEKHHSTRSTVCIGDPYATNLELFLVPDYYLATLERYEEIIKAKLL